MNAVEKKAILNALNEAEFRRDLLIPLLSKIGYIAPTEYHGTNERGKDIICLEYDKLGEQRFLAVVAKTGDFTGNVATSTGLMNIVNQVQQSFTSPYENLFNMRQVSINEVWIMTTGRIVPGAQEAVINYLRSYHLDKLIRVIGEDQLIKMIDDHFSTYWNSSNETKESVIIQRDRLLAFIESLLLANNIERRTIQEVKSTILNSTYNPRISTNTEGLNISSVSSYSIELGKIDSEFDDYIVTRAYSITKEAFQEAKRDLSYSFFDIEETIDHADKIMKLTNPWEFVVETESKLEREYPFNHNWGDGRDFINKVDILREGLQDLRRFKAFLDKKGKLEWTKQLALSAARLQPEIERIINNSKEEELIFNFAIRDDKEMFIEYDSQNETICFTVKYKRIDSNGFLRNKDGSLKPYEVLKTSLHKLREYVEKLLEYDEDKWFEEHEG